MTRKGTTCLLCGQTKANSYFAKHRNDNISPDVGFCKNCISGYEEKDTDSIIDLFRLMNIPFISSIWENITNESEQGVVGKYLRAIATRREFVSFSDSDFGKDTEHEEIKSTSKHKITPEMESRWGVDKTLDEYIALEGEYDSLVDIKIPASGQEEKRYVLNVKLKNALDKLLEDGDIKQVKSIREAYTKDLKELGLDIVSEDDEIKALGVRVQDWERTKPIPTLSEEFRDVDKIKEYFYKNLLIPMKRAFGQATEEEIAELNNIGDDSL